MDGFRTLVALSRVSKAWRKPTLRRLHSVLPIYSPHSPVPDSVYGLVDTMRDFALKVAENQSQGRSEQVADTSARTVRWEKVPWDDSDSDDEVGKPEDLGYGVAGRALAQSAKRPFWRWRNFGPNSTSSARMSSRRRHALSKASCACVSTLARSGLCLRTEG